MKTLFLMLVIGPYLAAQAADPNDNKPTEKQIIVTSVKEAVKLPAATADKTADFNVTIVDPADPTARKLNLKTATVEGVKARTDSTPMKFVLTTVDAAQPTPFKDKIVRVQALAANRTEIFTLENVKLTTLLGSEFITGKAVKYRNDRFSGTEVYLNLRDVLTIVAMTPEQAKKFNEARPRRPSNVPQGGQGQFNPPQGGQGPSVPPQGPYMPGSNPPGFNPQPPGQGPYTPMPGFNPQSPGGQYNPQRGYNPQPGNYPPQGGPGPNMPPQGYVPPQGGQGQGNPPQGGQPDRNPPEEPSGSRLTLIASGTVWCVISDHANSADR